MKIQAINFSVVRNTNLKPRQDPVAPVGKLVTSARLQQLAENLSIDNQVKFRGVNHDCYMGVKDASFQCTNHSCGIWNRKLIPPINGKKPQPGLKNS